MFACTTAMFYLLAHHVWALLLRTATCLRRFCLSAVFFSSACSPCLGSFAQNGYLLVSIPPLGDIYIYSYPLACHVWALCSKWLSCVKSIIRPCGLARPSRRYAFSLAALPPHSDMPLALRPKSIFYSTHAKCRIFFSHAPSRKNQFSICLTVNVNFIYFSHAPSRRNRFSIHLTVNANFFLTPPHGKSIFYLPHGKCRFYYSYASLRRYFIHTSWQ